LKLNKNKWCKCFYIFNSNRKIKTWIYT
jgi:hypothetical protein